MKAINYFKESITLLITHLKTIGKDGRSKIQDLMDLVWTQKN